MSQEQGNGEVEMPYPVLELLFMEKFSWTPVQIAEIPEKKLREILTVMDQRHKAIEQAAKMKEAAEKMKAELESKRKMI